jgi:hypothetical protein
MSTQSCIALTNDTLAKIGGPEKLKTLARSLPDPILSKAIIVDIGTKLVFVAECNGGGDLVKTAMSVHDSMETVSKRLALLGLSL